MFLRVAQYTCRPSKSVLSRQFPNTSVSFLLTWWRALSPSPSLSLSFSLSFSLSVFLPLSPYLYDYLSLSSSNSLWLDMLLHCSSTCSIFVPDLSTWVSISLKYSISNNFSIVVGMLDSSSWTAHMSIADARDMYYCSAWYVLLQQEFYNLQ